MMLLWWKLAGWVKALPVKLVLGVVLALAVAVTLWLWRNSIIDTVRLTDTIREHENYQATQEAIDDALESIRGLSPDAARDWLRDFGSTSR